MTLRDEDQSGCTPQMIAAFTEATVTVFQELTNTVVARGSNTGLGGPLIHSTIKLLGNPPRKLTLSFPPTVLEVLASRYLAGAASLTPELILDAAGEFANVIAGQAKTMLKGTPEHFQLTTPLVFQSHETSTEQEHDLPASLFFESDVGTFRLELHQC